MQKKDFHALSSESGNLQQNRQTGFSLIELMIALIIFAVVVAAIYGLLEAGRSDRFVTNQRVEAMQNLRIALNAIGRDALNAGFEFPAGGALLPKDTLSPLLGGVLVKNTTVDFLTPIIAGPDVTTNNLSSLETDQVTFAYRDVTFNNNQLLDVKAITADGSEATLSSINTPCKENDIYIISGTTDPAIGVMTETTSGNTVRFEAGDLLGLNRPSASNAIQRAVTAPSSSLSRIQLVTFHVLPDGTLMRTVYGNYPNGRQGMPLAYGVEDMIVEYVLSNGNVTISPAPDDFSRVSQVRVTITARGLREHNKMVDGNGQPMFFKVTLTSVFNTRNISYFQ